jgi:hypothetical protein
MNSDTYVGMISGVFGGMAAQRWAFVVLIVVLLAIALAIAFFPGRQRRPR